MSATDEARSALALARATAARALTAPGAPGRRSALLIEFQSNATEIEYRPPPRLARATLYAVVALIASAVVWASVSHVDTIVAAQGKLVTTSPNIVVQPLETSVIRAMYVKAGDRVARGDALATLDPTFSQADFDALRGRRSALDAAIGRLQAELRGEPFSPSAAASADELLQADVYRQRKAHYDAQIHDFDTQIASAKANLKTARAEETVLVQRLETMRSIETMRDTLAAREIGSKLNMFLSREARLEVESNLARVRGAIEEQSHRVDKADADRAVFVEDFRRAAYQELVETLAKSASAAEELKKAELRRNLIVLQAPADAVVLEIAGRSVGSVAREAEPLFMLAPRNSPLQAEVNVEGRDIGQIAVGQPVRVKFDAFPFQKYGAASGIVRVISQDAFAPDARNDASHDKKTPYYRVVVDLTEVRLRASGERTQLLPGMAVTAEMKVGDRSVMSYFLYPLLRGLDESIREY